MRMPKTGRFGLVTLVLAGAAGWFLWLKPTLAEGTRIIEAGTWGKSTTSRIGDVSTNGLLSSDPVQVHRALKDLKAAGWLGLEGPLAETDRRNTGKDGEDERQSSR